MAERGRERERERDRETETERVDERVDTNAHSYTFSNIPSSYCPLCFRRAHALPLHPPPLPPLPNQFCYALFENIRRHLNSGSVHNLSISFFSKHFVDFINF